MIFLDLDGPLLDVSPRYHTLHCELVQRHGGVPLSAGAYWPLKRSRTPEALIFSMAGLSPQAAADACGQRLERIETAALTAHDRLWPWTISTLEALSARGPLVLVTQRSQRALTLAQLARLDIARFFQQVLSGRGDNTELAKAGMIRSAGYAPAPDAVLVGDTEVDLQSARALGVRAVGVRSGIRTGERLSQSQPDVLLTCLADLPGWLDETGWPVVS